MRTVRRLLPLAGLLALAACDLTDLLEPGAADAPRNLAYTLEPSGDPSAPLGVLLTWDAPRDGRALTYQVYGRSSTAGQWRLRATTTSTSFHDVGTPQRQYYVLAQDEQGDAMGESDVITLDDRQLLPAPQSLASVTLNGAVQLLWAANAVTAGGGAFDHYRVYSARYDVAQDRCGAQWALEGTTVSDAFLVGNLQNGTRLCFAVSAISHDGHESPWSGVRTDTPRLDAHNVLVWAAPARTDSSGFLFRDASASRYGVVGALSRGDLDLTVQRASDGSLWLTPARGGVQLAVYGNAPVSDLGAVDRAPVTGWSTGAIEALGGWAYAVKVQQADGTHYAAIRVTLATSSYVVIDWAYQSAVGNPELQRGTSAPVLALQ